MSVLITSISAEAQTLNGHVLPPWGSQTRPASTPALVAAVAAKTIQMSPVASAAGASHETDYSVAPVTGATVVPPEGCAYCNVMPAGTLATLTLNMPTSPDDGQKFTVTFDQVVTALTMAGGTIKGALTAAAAKGFATWRYSAGDSTWYRIG